MLKENKLVPPSIDLSLCKVANNNILNLKTYNMDSLVTRNFIIKNKARSM